MQRRWPGPLRTLLETLQLPDLTELQDPQSTPAARPGLVAGEVAVAGFICSSDPNATAGWFTAPISYRGDHRRQRPPATTARSPSVACSRLQNVQAADGLGYTAGFSERLVGDNRTNHAAIGNYRVVPGPLADGGCPATDDATAWRGDAGSSWSWSDYRHTLYNHVLPPNGHPSCVAADGKTALMGASSGHVRGLNVLLLDGSVPLVTRDIDLRVWKEFARQSLITDLEEPHA